MVEVDHDSQDYTEFQMHSAEFSLNPPAEVRNGQRRLSDLNGIAPTIESVAARLHAPVTSNRIDMDKISFERNKTGIWGWRSDKNENINGYECKVFAASNVEFVTRTRNEHLNESQARVGLCFIYFSFFPLIHCQFKTEFICFSDFFFRRPFHKEEHFFLVPFFFGNISKLCFPL